MFARIFANTVETKAQANPELARAKQTIKEHRTELVAVEEHLTQAEARANAAEKRFAAAGDLFVRLFAEEKRQRILAAAERRPQLPPVSIAWCRNLWNSFRSYAPGSVQGQGPIPRRSADDCGIHIARKARTRGNDCHLSIELAP